MFLEARLRDIENDEAHFVDSTALFINMKPQANSIVKADVPKQQENDPMQDLREKSNPDLWNDEPRYNNLIKDLGF